MKLCKNCKHSIPDPVLLLKPEYATCAISKNVNLASGRPVFCTTERLFGWFSCRLLDSSCGKEGRFFEAKS